MKVNMWNKYLNFHSNKAFDNQVLLPSHFNHETKKFMGILIFNTVLNPGSSEIETFIIIMKNGK